MRSARAIRWITASGVLALALLAARSASAVYACGPDKDDCQCGMDDPYPCCSNGGNCTWWAWEQACCKWSVGLPGWGNANQWAGNAKAHPSYEVLSSPVVGSIANRVSGTYGHVAWVTAVNGSTITVSEQNCWGGYGHQSANYNASYFDGGFIVRNSQCECQPGQTQTESCGNCGERKRTCATTCKWNSWGACGGEGECTPGQTEDQACGDCGHQSRTCGNDCSWAAFGTCEATASTGTASDCNTGKKGVCAVGVEKCVGGTTECVPLVSPSAETCDGLDNDCNGLVDDGVSCGKSVTADAGAWPKPSTSKTQTVRPPENSDEEGGFGCAFGSSSNRSGSGVIWLLSLIALGLHRRRPAVR